MKYSRFLGAALAALLSSAALAQPYPQVGVTWGYVPAKTYSAAFIGLVPAASATDLVCLSGSSTKTIALQSVKLSGTAGTLVTLPVTLLRRAALDSGGTAASTTANPANTISKRDTGNATATAVPISYTANPTINDTSPTYIDSASMTLNVTGTTAAAVVPLVFDFAKDAVNLLQAPVLRGTTQQICVNLNAISVSSGVINGSLSWVEY
jgi:hypothetical protein